LTDTIVAVATPPGEGGVGIVRLSGPEAASVATAIINDLPPPRRAALRNFRDAAGEIIDTGLVLYFPAPHSYTGEDIVELHGHGGPVLLDMLVEVAVAAGARTARPGEFSERAFLNGKLDLAQAEAIADLIASTTKHASRAAQRTLQGAFSTRVNALVAALIELRSYVEAAIDFPEDEIDFLSDEKVSADLRTVAQCLDAVLGVARQGCVLREGLHVVIAGRPNVGKSSLLNQLAGRDTAIVTDIPGTTRDVLREHIQIDGMPLHVMDTAGLRDTGDAVEQEGVRRAWGAIEICDRVLLVVDDRFGVQDEERAILAKLPEGQALTVIANKIDLSGRAAGVQPTELGSELALSAKTGAGLDLLRGHLKECAGYRPAGEHGFLARRRHLDALDRASACIDRGKRLLSEQNAGELLAEELRQAQHALGEITGVFTTDDLLDRIFSSFCIGK